MVVLIHGTTFGRDQVYDWSSIRSALTEGGQVGVAEFTWSGRNSERDRLAAAASLAQQLDCIGKNVRILAHSHGGYVAVEAAGLMRNPKSVDRLITLGTPYMRYRPAAPSALVGLIALSASLLLLDNRTLVGTATSKAADLARGLYSDFLLLNGSDGITRWSCYLLLLMAALGLLLVVMRSFIAALNPVTRTIQWLLRRRRASRVFRELNGRVFAIHHPLDEAVAGLRAVIAPAPPSIFRAATPGFLRWIAAPLVNAADSIFGWRVVRRLQGTDLSGMVLTGVETAPPHFTSYCLSTHDEQRLVQGADQQLTDLVSSIREELSKRQRGAAGDVFGGFWDRFRNYPLVHSGYLKEAFAQLWVDMLKQDADDAKWKSAVAATSSPSETGRRRQAVGERAGDMHYVHQALMDTFAVFVVALLLLASVWSVRTAVRHVSSDAVLRSALDGRVSLIGLVGSDTAGRVATVRSWLNVLGRFGKLHVALRDLSLLNQTEWKTKGALLILEAATTSNVDATGLRQECLSAFERIIRHRMASAIQMSAIVDAMGFKWTASTLPLLEWESIVAEATSLGLDPALQDLLNCMRDGTTDQVTPGREELLSAAIGGLATRARATSSSRDHTMLALAVRKSVDLCLVHPELMGRTLRDVDAAFKTACNSEYHLRAWISEIEERKRTASNKADLSHDEQTKLAADAVMLLCVAAGQPAHAQSLEHRQLAETIIDSLLDATGWLSSNPKASIVVQAMRLNAGFRTLQANGTTPTATLVHCVKRLLKLMQDNEAMAPSIAYVVERMQLPQGPQHDELRKERDRLLQVATSARAVEVYRIAEQAGGIDESALVSLWAGGPLEEQELGIVEHMFDEMPNDAAASKSRMQLATLLWEEGIGNKRALALRVIGHCKAQHQAEFYQWLAGNP